MAIDYTTFTDGAANASATPGIIDRYWWKVDLKDRAQSVAAVVKTIAEYDSKRQAQYQISARLYGNISLMGMNGMSYSKVASVQGTLKDRVSYNVVQSGIDTLVSKMGKNKPKPLFLTSGGDYKIQRKAKKLNKFIDGTFYENSAYDLGPIILRDAGVIGDGLVHVFEGNGRVKYERVIASEMYVDWAESFYGKPRQLHRVKNVDRNVLIDMFPSKRKVIMNTNGATADLIGNYQNVADQVTVVESWHLPSGPDASDGLHSINLINDNLVDEEWTKNYFPFAKLGFSPRMYGWWSQSGVEQIQNIQLEINKLLWVIQRSMHLAGTFKVWLKTGTKLPKEHISNDIGAILQGDEPPQYLVPPIVQPEIYQHLESLKNKAYEQLGVSQLSATSKKPEGLNSGRALREFNDIESDRFMTIGHFYEKFYLDLAHLSIDCARDIYKRDKKYDVRVPSKSFVETIDWKDIDLEEDEYVMKAYPVSSLPDDPAGRLQTIQEYIQAGFMDPMTGRRLLDFPDLEATENLANAQLDWISMVLDKIIDEGEFTPPDPAMNFDLAKQMQLQYYAYGKTSGLEEEKLAMLQQFDSQLSTLKAKALAAMQATQPPPGAGAPGAAPQAAPMPQPQSDLIPNVPGIPSGQA